MHLLNRTFFLLLLFVTSLVSGDIEQHLKKVSNKSGLHTMRNIDFIYLINLDQRPEKLRCTLEQLRPYGITPYRFSAVNGWKLSLEAINDVGVKFSPEMEGGFMATSYPFNGDYKQSHEIIHKYGQTYFCHCMSRGAIGIALSHISILQDAYDSEYETIWVIEDDVEILKNPRILSDLVDKLDQLVGKGNWDVLYTDRDTRHSDGSYCTTYYPAKRPDFSGSNDFALKEEISPDFRQIGARFGAYSMILRRSGIRKLLQFFKSHQIYLPYDMDNILPPGIKLFTVIENVVASLPEAISDNGAPRYFEP